MRILITAMAAIMVVNCSDADAGRRHRRSCYTQCCPVPCNYQNNCCPRIGQQYSSCCYDQHYCSSPVMPEPCHDTLTPVSYESAGCAGDCGVDTQPAHQEAAIHEASSTDSTPVTDGEEPPQAPMPDGQEAVVGDEATESIEDVPAKPGVN